MKKRKKTPENIDLCLRMKKGGVASSPSFHWTIMNAVKSKPDPTHKPITLEDFHGRA